MVDFVGKSLVVLITALCLTFMAWSVGLYMTHQPWREMVTQDLPGHTALTKQLETARAENTKQRDVLGALQFDIRAERTARLNRLTQLEAERVVLEKQLTEMVRRRSELSAEAQKTADDLKANEDVLEGKQKELKETLEQREQVIRDRERDFAKSKTVTAEAAELNVELGRLQKRHAQLVEQLKQLDATLAAKP